MNVDTSGMDPNKVVCRFEPQWYIQAAEAATEVGADDDKQVDPWAPEGFAISVLAVFACFLGALILAAVI